MECKDLTQRHRFIPFVNERDKLGQLIRPFGNLGASYKDQRRVKSTNVRHKRKKHNQSLPMSYDPRHLNNLIPLGSTTSSVRRFHRAQPNHLRITKFFPAKGAHKLPKASGMGITKKILQIRGNRGIKGSRLANFGLDSILGSTNVASPFDQ